MFYCIIVLLVCTVLFWSSSFDRRRGGEIWYTVYHGRQAFERMIRFIPFEHLRPFFGCFCSFGGSFCLVSSPSSGYCVLFTKFAWVDPVVVMLPYCLRHTVCAMGSSLHDEVVESNTPDISSVRRRMVLLKYRP